RGVRIVVRNETSLLSRFKYDLLVLGFLALIGVGWWLNTHPFTFDSDNEEAGGDVPPQMGSGEVLLILPGDTTNPDEFEEMDFSFAWYNSLAQEIGAFATVFAEDLVPEDLEARHLVVVPSKAGQELDPAHIGLLLAFVQQGGNLIVEMPGPSWSGLSGVGEPVLVG